MKKILYIFGFCCLLALGFTACQQEEDALVQLNLEELQKRDSKKHPKLEYVTNSANNSVPPKQSSRLKYTLKNDGETLHVFFKLDSGDAVSVTIKDMDNNAYVNEPVAYLKSGKEFVIHPADHFPYYFEISSDAILYKGTITKE
ncbi:MAG: hypothetical protein IJL37_02495 [Bacteroidaceae bacterium]|nr:hypothetical protein [Bacteroidaceae bacterium]